MSFFKLFIFFLFTTTLFSASNYSTAIKEKKIYPMGKKIYEKRCQNIEPAEYKSYKSLEQALKNKAICKKLNSKHLEAVLLYLWEVKRVDKEEKHFEKFSITKEDKCPVCGMFVYKYPTWIAKIECKSDVHYFDGIKDLFKYYFRHKKNSKNILVQDYYTQKILDARESFFVIGSDVYGPMGNEFIAFETLQSAKKFMLDHKAKQLVKFDDINEDMVYSLDD